MRSSNKFPLHFWDNYARVSADAHQPRVVRLFSRHRFSCAALPRERERESNILFSKTKSNTCVYDGARSLAAMTILRRGSESCQNTPRRFSKEKKNTAWDCTCALGGFSDSYHLRAVGVGKGTRLES